MKIIFLGTPTFAVPSLEKLIEHALVPVAVVSQPDRETDRKGRLKPTPVKAAAEAHGIQVLQFDNINKYTQALEQLKPDLMITAAYGQILSEEFLRIAPVFNVHASLLPAYRGSSPIQAAILNGDKKAGVTIMKTVRAMDAGDCILQEGIELGAQETYGELHDRLSLLGANLIVQAVKDFALAKTVYTPQDANLVTFTKKIIKADGRIDWQESATTLMRKVRALNPWPTAYTYSADVGGDIKIYTAKSYSAEEFKQKLGSMSHIDCKNAPNSAGTVLCADEKQGLFVQTGKGVLELLSLQSPGKRVLSAQDFLRGCKEIRSGSVLGS